MSLRNLLKNKILRGLIKFLLVASLLAYLGERGFLSAEETRKALSRLDLLIPAFLMLAAASAMSVVRWRWLVRAQGIDIPWIRSFQLCCVGFFFNIALPGAVSGDVIKAIYVAREIRGERARAFSSIILDRVVGVSGLILVALGALLLSLSSPIDGKALQAVYLLVAGAGAGVVIFFGYLFVVREDQDPLLRLFQHLESRFKFVGSLTRTYEGIRTYHEQRGCVIRSLLLSIVIHILGVSSCVICAFALGINHIPIGSLFVVIPIGLILTAIPVTPAGVGTGHAAFLALFALLGSQRGADVFSLFLLYMILEGSFGGLVYLRFKSQLPMDEIMNEAMDTQAGKG